MTVALPWDSRLGCFCGTGGRFCGICDPIVYLLAGLPLPLGLEQLGG